MEKSGRNGISGSYSLVCVCDPAFLIQFTQFSPNQQMDQRIPEGCQSLSPTQTVWMWTVEKRVNVNMSLHNTDCLLLTGLFCVVRVKLTRWPSWALILHVTWRDPHRRLARLRLIPTGVRAASVAWASPLWPPAAILHPAASCRKETGVYYAPPSCSQTTWKELHLLWEKKARINDWEKWQWLKASGVLRGNKRVGYESHKWKLRLKKLNAA